MLIDKITGTGNYNTNCFCQMHNLIILSIPATAQVESV